MAMNLDDDPRTIDELLLAASTESDQHLAWSAISELQRRGTRQIFERASELCVSQCSFERRLGADILGQLGTPETCFPNERRTVLLNMLADEKDGDVLHSVLVALSHNYFNDVVRHVLRFVNHPDSSVRYAMALALTGHEEQAAINSLIRLSADDDSDVRDWATFGLGTQCDLDTPELRDALAARLDDPDDDTRAEGIMGLARRNDPRAIPAIQRELASDEVGSLVLEAAELLGLRADPDSR